MDFSESEKFMVLLWKNFILKRRRCIALVVEMVLTFLFSAALLATRSVITIKNGPFDFAAQPVDEVPFYITASLISPSPLELAYVPSRSTVVQGIIERVKMDLNPQMKGVGYHIVMVKTPDCNVEEISKLIHYYIPTATLENNVGTELSFILPKMYVHSFQVLFTALEQEQENLGIASFGASVTTMEEVFLKVGYMEESQTDHEAMQSSSQMGQASNRNQNKNISRNVEGADPPTLNESPTINFNTGCSLYSQQFRAMFIKRVMFNWRNWKLLFLQILGLIGSLAFLLRSSNTSSQDEIIRQMDLSQYGQTIVSFSISGNSDLTANISKHLEGMLKSDNQIPQEVQGDLLRYLREEKDCINLCIIALSIELKANMIMLTALFNNEAYHSPSVALAMLDNILFKSLSGANASLTVSNKPQPPPDVKDNEEPENGQQLALSLQFGMALLISGFCLLTVTERTTKAKHIQFVSGVSVIVYWLSALLWDFIIFFASCCLVMGVIKYCKFDIYVTDYHILETMLIFTLYGWSAIPFVYLISFVFSGSTSAFIKLLLLNYFSGTFGFLIGETLEDSNCEVSQNFPFSGRQQ
ncbi:phospholipid-transporting ATPase ABCA3-like isoform X1 [Pan troglodytes]|uniref:phospholipid-transporting ATPase ABCA3-like isoform X1 n=2 Tax=Pan troglodytes TaxID=9598 RepID=UPI000D098BAB|nr:phospholipid-transporting ATPase ABCA3-like isoform X1 [Pan troglodytes]